VIDWAFSKKTFTNQKINKVHCGTVQYQAPEIEEKLNYNSKVDVWAFGAILF
jgi:serine/threonine protein kinase